MKRFIVMLSIALMLPAYIRPPLECLPGEWLVNGRCVRLHSTPACPRGRDCLDSRVR